MSIELRSVPNDHLLNRAGEITGLHINTDFTDVRGRLVSGKFISAKAMENGRIGLKLERYLDGRHVMDGANIPAGVDPMGRPWTTTVHVPTGHALLEEAA